MTADKIASLTNFFRARVTEVKGQHILVPVDFMRHLLAMPQAETVSEPVPEVELAPGSDPHVEPAELPRRRRRKENPSDESL
jgi:hypothetical protein